jgi:hypothetical protein
LLGGVTIDFGTGMHAKDPYCNIFIDVWDEGEPAPPRRAAAPTASPGTPSAQPTPLPTGAPPPAQQCQVCGDESTQTACQDWELFYAEPTQCPDDTPYCMNTFIQVGMKTTQYKRCVGTVDAYSLWWAATSDEPLCYKFDASHPLDYLVCHIACYGHMCNEGTTTPVPPEDTLFHPPGWFHSWEYEKYWNNPNRHHVRHLEEVSGNVSACLSC